MPTMSWQLTQSMKTPLSKEQRIMSQRRPRNLNNESRMCNTTRWLTYQAVVFEALFVTRNVGVYLSVMHKSNRIIQGHDFFGVLNTCVMSFPTNPYNKKYFSKKKKKKKKPPALG
eukprot:FR741379.1.p2 GENE.FR741379.1~~FR741379.1.p2  ORF type:complete len:115 (+),score=29.47 FR741379.1:581-925(+)